MMGSLLGNLVCLLMIVGVGLWGYLVAREIENAVKGKDWQKRQAQDDDEPDWWDQPADPDDSNGWTNGDYVIASDWDNFFGKDK
jgi:hypothetical protein